MERKDVLNLEKLCLENDNLLAFPLAADLLGVPYANLYKFFRSGRNEGLFLREKVGAMYYIKFAPSLPQTGPPLDKRKAKLKLLRKPRTVKTKKELLGKTETLEIYFGEAEPYLMADEAAEAAMLFEKLCTGIREEQFFSIDPAVNRRLKQIFEGNHGFIGTIEAVESLINNLRPVRKMPVQKSDELYAAQMYFMKWRGWGHTELRKDGARYFKFGCLAQQYDYLAAVECFRKWISKLSKKQLVFLDADGQIVYKPYRTRFTHNGRKKHLREMYEEIFTVGETKFKAGTFITLTTNPENFPSMKAANDAMSHNWNRFMAALRKRYRNRKLMYINVREFQKNGRLHMHIVLFGVTLEQDIKDKKKNIFTNSYVEKMWKKYGQGSVTNTIPLKYDKETQKLGWGREKPNDCGKKQDPMNYLKKYLSKVLDGNNPAQFDKSIHDYTPTDDAFDESQEFDDEIANAYFNAESLFQYWGNNCRFYTYSPGLISKETAERLFLLKLKLQELRRRFPLMMVGVYDTELGTFQIKQQNTGDLSG